MVKPIVLQICILFLVIATGEGKNTQTFGDSTKSSQWSGFLSVANKNIWRGIDFGNGAPTVQGMLTYRTSPKFDINVLGISALTGTNLGYANTLNFFLNYKWKALTITLDDYYFHGDASNIQNNYWDYKNAHFLEMRLAYTYKRWEFKSGYTLYGGGFYSNPIIDSAGTVLKNTRGLYLEANYKFTDYLTLTVGGITGSSALNFMDKGGITNIGLKYSKAIQMTERFALPIDCAIIVNPNYENIAPKNLPRVGYGNQSVNFVVSLSLQ